MVATTSPIAVFLALVVVSSSLLASISVMATSFQVGGRDGWVLKPSVRYDQWAQGLRVRVNDTLVFKYDQGSDTVLQVTKEDYLNCNPRPLKVLQSGSDVFKFDRSGPFYFIAGGISGSNTLRCLNGQKLAIVVLAVRPPSTPKTPVTPLPSPKASPALPPTSPVPSPAAHNPSLAPHHSPPASPTPISAAPHLAPRPSAASPSPIPVPPHLAPRPSASSPAPHLAPRPSASSPAPHLAPRPSASSPAPVSAAPHLAPRPSASSRAPQPSAASPSPISVTPSRAPQPSPAARPVASPAGSPEGAADQISPDADDGAPKKSSAVASTPALVVVGIAGLVSFFM